MHAPCSTHLTAHHMQGWVYPHPCMCQTPRPMHAASSTHLPHSHTCTLAYTPADVAAADPGAWRRRRVGRCWRRQVSRLLLLYLATGCTAFSRTPPPAACCCCVLHSFAPSVLLNATVCHLSCAPQCLGLHAHSFTSPTQEHRRWAAEEVRAAVLAAQQGLPAVGVLCRVLLAGRLECPLMAALD